MTSETFCAITGLGFLVMSIADFFLYRRAARNFDETYARIRKDFIARCEQQSADYHAHCDQLGREYKESLRDIEAAWRERFRTLEAENAQLRRINAGLRSGRGSSLS